MKIKGLGLLLVAVTLAACARSAPVGVQAERLLENATWTFRTFRTSSEPTIKNFPAHLTDAKALAIFPALYKAGFMVGAEGGNGVLIARGDDGTWGQPAFYTLGAGSFGFQLGGQVAETILVVRSKGALEALVKHQAKLGGDVQVTGGTVGAGLEASTTTNAGADVVVFSRAAGVYGGFSLEGGVMARRTDYNEAVYGTGATPEAIVLEGKLSSPKTQALRDALNRK